MYLPYANLVHFSTEPAYGAPSEAALTLQVLEWVGEAQDIIDASYRFTVDYQYGQTGLAEGASILVQREVNGVWVTLGRYSPFGVTLSSVIATIPTSGVCTPSDIISEPIHYYVSGYYAPGYYT